jgi:hypothetical protein
MWPRRRDTQRTRRGLWPERLAALGDVRPLDHNKDSRAYGAAVQTRNVIDFRAQPEIVCFK